MNDTFKLIGSRDEITGEIFFPARELAADGSLRPLVGIELPTTGTLHSWATVGGTTYGLVDLGDGVRLQTELVAGTPELDATYRLCGNENEWSFERA